MASVSVQGGSTGQVVIQTTSSAVSAVAQAALSAISARIAAGTDFAETYSGVGTVGQPTHETAVTISAAVSLTMPSTSGVNAIVSDATAPVAIDDERSIPVTIISGAGGLTFDRTSSVAGPALIVATAGTNAINLGAGAATVAADGVTSINALGGAASILAGAAGQATVSIGGADTVNLAGVDALDIAAQAAAAIVTAQDGANVMLSNPTGLAAPVVQLAAGTEIVGTMAGSVATVAGSLGGLMLVSAWGGRTFIDPAASNVTVFAGSGSETLFGAGDASLPGVTVPASMTLANSGSDFVFGGQGYFHGGTGPLNMLMTSTVAGAATLVGGGTVDLLFAQGAGDSLRGAAGTVIMNAAGFAEPGFSVAGAAGGVALDAGASNAFMFGSAWGANTVTSGSGAATVFGNHGVGAFGAAGQVGNVYVDGGGGGSLAIMDFLPGADIVSLHGAALSGVTTVAAGGAQTPGTYVSLNDGTTIALVDRFLTTAQVAASLR